MQGRLATAALAAALCLGPARASRAGEPGTAGANFLRLAAGPRGTGMGEAQTAAVDDVYATYWNPAALTRVRYPEAALMYNSLYQGMDQQYLAYAHPLGPGRTVAASLTRFAVAPFDSYDANGFRRGSVSASDLALGAHLGQSLDLPWSRAPELSVGVSGKLLEERLAQAGARTLALDLGFHLSRLDGLLGEGARGLSVAAALRNAGPGLKFHSDTAPLPRTLALGVAFERTVWGDPIVYAADYERAVDDNGVLSIGAEYRLHRVLAMRLGFKTGQDTGLGLRLGFGITLKRMSFEYALAGFGVLGNMHRFGIHLRFGGPADLKEKGAEDFVRQGESYLRQNRQYEAIMEFNQALRLDPGNPKSLEGIRKATGAMKTLKKPEAPNAPR